MANIFQKLAEMWNAQSTPDDEYEYDDRDDGEKDPYSSDDYYSDDSYPKYSAPKYEAPKYTPSYSESSWKSGTSESSEDILRNLERRIAEERGSAGSTVTSTAPASAAAARTSGTSAAQVDVKEDNVKKGSSSLEVAVFSPDRFSDETRKIADELVKEEHTVVLSLENCDKDNSRRIIDFMSGAAYATGGKIKRAAASTFVVIPHCVTLKGDELLSQLEESGVL